MAVDAAWLPPACGPMLEATFRKVMAVGAHMASAHMWANIGRRFQLPNTNNTSTSSST
jgi:hypothetical protein